MMITLTSDDSVIVNINEKKNKLSKGMLIETFYDKVLETVNTKVDKNGFISFMIYILNIFVQRI